jgi:hypothetical protein
MTFHLADRRGLDFDFNGRFGSDFLNRRVTAAGDGRSRQ